MERLSEINKKLTKNISYYYSSKDGVSIEEMIKLNMAISEVENKLLQYFLLNKIHGQRGFRSFRNFLDRIIKINERSDVKEKLEGIEVLLRDFGINI